MSLSSEEIRLLHEYRVDHKVYKKFKAKRKGKAYFLDDISYKFGDNVDEEIKTIISDVYLAEMGA